FPHPHDHVTGRKLAIVFTAPMLRVENECFRRIHHTALESIAELSHLHNYNVSIQIVLFAVNIIYAANRRELLALWAMKKPSCRVFTTIVVAFAIVLFSSKSQPKQIVSRADQTGQLAFSPNFRRGGLIFQFGDLARMGKST